MKLSNSMISQNTSNYEKIRNLIDSMKPEIGKTFSK